MSVVLVSLTHFLSTSFPVTFYHKQCYILGKISGILVREYNFLYHEARIMSLLSCTKGKKLKE